MINLRGIIVPIVDLRIKFGLGTVEYTPFTVVIILNIAQRVIGIVVDSVSDVTSLTGGQIRQAPDFSEVRHQVHPRPRHDRQAHADRHGYPAPDEQPGHGIDRRGRRTERTSSTTTRTGHCPC